MKTEKLFAFALVAILAVLSGCATGGKIDRLAFTPTEFRTNIIAPHVTELVQTQNVIVTVTNQAGQVSHTTNREAVVVNVTTPGQTNVQPVAWEANAATVAAIQGATSFIPGYGGLIGTGAAALLGILAQLRSRKYRAAALSIAEGVNEAIASLPPESKQPIIDSQKITQQNAGTRETVRALLKTLAP